MKALKLKETTFYQHFNSFEQLEKDIWQDIFERTQQAIMQEDEYSPYSVNEKLLAFYFTWIETLKEVREYVAFVIREESVFEFYPACFDKFKHSFEQFGAQLVEEGIATGEIASRMFITDKYSKVLWYQPVSLVKFWVKDQSENFADTDALIEKTVNFSFDVMRSNSLDSFFDLAKFHIRHF
jgi:AcrR family transcriptional regulator